MIINQVICYDGVKITQDWHDVCESMDSIHGKPGLYMHSTPCMKWMLNILQVCRRSHVTKCGYISVVSVCEYREGNTSKLTFSWWRTSSLCLCRPLYPAVSELLCVRGWLCAQYTASITPLDLGVFVWLSGVYSTCFVSPSYLSLCVCFAPVNQSSPFTCPLGW